MIKKFFLSIFILHVMCNNILFGMVECDDSILQNIFDIISRGDCRTLKIFAPKYLYMHDSYSGDTPLMLAIRKRNTAIKDYLVSQGALKIAIKDIHLLTKIAKDLIFWCFTPADKGCGIVFNKVFLNRIVSDSSMIDCPWEHSEPCDLSSFYLARMYVVSFIETFFRDGVLECLSDSQCFLTNRYTLQNYAAIKICIVRLLGSRIYKGLNQSMKNPSLNEVFFILQSIKEYLCNDGCIPLSDQCGCSSDFEMPEDETDLELKIGKLKI